MPAQEVAERRIPGDVPVWAHPDWIERWSWLVQGTTGRGDGDAWDFGLSGGQPVGAAMERWRALRAGLGMPTAVHARQVHGARVETHDAPLPPGLVVMEGFDGHVTAQPALLLTVSVADCVPVFLVDPDRRCVAVVHAGWRGVAEGIVETALAAVAEREGASAADVWVHTGPAICGSCYEVGPEVHEAVNPDRNPPVSATPIDLRASIARRAAAARVAPDRITGSVHCTRCGPGEFFSHRGGSAARQMAVIGVRIP